MSNPYDLREISTYLDLKIWGESPERTPDSAKFHKDRVPRTYEGDIFDPQAHLTNSNLDTLLRMLGARVQKIKDKSKKITPR